MSSGNENQRKALGRGISALLPGRPINPPVTPTGPPPPNIALLAVQPAVVVPPPEPGHNSILNLPIGKIEPNPINPRTVFQQEKLAELAQSIKSNGIIQPLVVRKAPGRLPTDCRGTTLACGEIGGPGNCSGGGAGIGRKPFAGSGFD